MFQARQQTHERDMKLLEIKVQQEKLEAAKIEQQMDIAKQRGKDASKAAKAVIRRVQGDGQEDELTSKYNNNTSSKLDTTDNIRPKRASKQASYYYDLT